MEEENKEPEQKNYRTHELFVKALQELKCAQVKQDPDVKGRYHFWYQGMAYMADRLDDLDPTYIIYIPGAVTALTSDIDTTAILYKVANEMNLNMTPACCIPVQVENEGTTVIWLRFRTFNQMRPETFTDQVRMALQNAVPAYRYFLKRFQEEQNLSLIQKIIKSVKSDTEKGKE